MKWGLRRCGRGCAVQPRAAGPLASLVDPRYAGVDRCCIAAQGDRHRRAASCARFRWPCWPPRLVRPLCASVPVPDGFRDLGRQSPPGSRWLSPARWFGEEADEDVDPAGQEARATRPHYRLRCGEWPASPAGRGRPGGGSCRRRETSCRLDWVHPLRVQRFARVRQAGSQVLSGRQRSGPQ